MYSTLFPSLPWCHLGAVRQWGTSARDKHTCICRRSGCLGGETAGREENSPGWSRQGGSLSASLSPERKREGGLEEFFPGKTDTLALLKSRRHTDTLATALHCDCTANILELRL
ncbi:hypothetical protein BRADI_2g50406v3 [Brachypodium distachyon]|uniref:Uncharacterized protein n=1 Tax=Brachypodium distachyon TaxID=15368 RepID=A0A2K2DF34_BRADI|nr:hypothetical protein BRADI_2g50406v3 [Brachypodium distachyon]